MLFDIKVVLKTRILIGLSVFVLVLFSNSTYPAVDFNEDIPYPNRDCCNISELYPMFRVINIDTPTPPKPYPITDLAAHRIIPYSTLKLFYSTVLNRKEQFPQEFSNLADVFLFMLSKIRVFVKDPTNFSSHENSLFLEQVTDFSEDIRRGKFPEIPGNPYFAFPELTEGLLTFATIYNWLPGNMFIGPEPQYRSDDPGQNFEINAETIVGNERFEVLYFLNQMMNLYIDNPHDFAHYSEIIRLLNALVQSEMTIYKFNPSDWEVNQNTEKWEIKKPFFEAKKRKMQHLKINSHKGKNNIISQESLDCSQLMNSIYKEMQIIYVTGAVG